MSAARVVTAQRAGGRGPELRGERVILIAEAPGDDALQLVGDDSTASNRRSAPPPRLLSAPARSCRVPAADITGCSWDSRYV